MKIRRKKGEVLTNIKISFMNNKMKRCIVYTDERLSDYLAANEVYIASSDKEEATRLGAQSAKRNGKYIETIISAEMFYPFALQLRRVTDQVEGKRSRHSIASEAQIKRVKQFYEILQRLPDCPLYCPPEVTEYSHGEIGQLYSILETVLIAKDLWDPEAKVETEKAKGLKSKKK